MRPPRAQGVRWGRWILVGWCAAFSIVGAGRVQDTDPYWQVRAGQEWLDGITLARPDSWSWAPVDGLFYPNSPLWNAALAIAWGVAESWGMFMLTALTIAAYFALAVHLARRLAASSTGTTIAVIVTGLVALPALSPRPGMAAQVLLLAGVAGASAWSMRAARHSTATSASVVGAGGLALSAVGNWVHLSWSTTALGMAAAWASLWSLTPTLGAARRVVLISVGTLALLAGIALGPYGWAAYERTRAVVAASAGMIEEWTAPFATASGPLWGALSLAIVGACLASAAWCWRTWRAGRASDPRLRVMTALTVLALPTALLGLVYARFVPSAVLTIAPITALASTALADRAFVFGLRSRRSDLLTDAAWQRILGLVLVVVAPVALVLAAGHSQPATHAVNAALPPGCRLFSTPDEASAVILMRPDVTVWVDGRSDYWGRERLQLARDYLAVRDPAQLVPEGATCLMLPAHDASKRTLPLLAALDASPDWERAAENGAVILWLPAAPAAD